MAEGTKVLEAYVEVGAKTDEADKGVDDLKKKVKTIHPEVEKVGKTFEETMKKVKESLGKRSGVGEFFELLRGAGAIGGLAIVGEVLKSAAEKAEDLSIEYHKGTMSGAELAVSIGKAVPIFGTIYEAVEDIGVAIDGNKARQEKFNEEVKRANELYDLQKALRESQEDLTKSGVQKLHAADQKYNLAGTQPGVQRSVMAKRQENETEDMNLREEMSPQENKRRMTDAMDKLTDQQNAELSKAKTPEEVEKINKEYEEKQNATKEGINRYNETLKTYNEQTIKTLDKATGMEIDEIQSGAEEIFSIRSGAANKLSETNAGKLEDFRAVEQHKGYTGKALDNLVEAKKEDLRATAMTGTRSELRGLNQEYANTAATTFTEKVAANRKELEEQARTGKITAESIDELSAAYAKVQLAAVDNQLKDMRINLEQVGETDLQKKVEDLVSMGASAEQAAEAAKLLKDTLTGNDIHDVLNQLAIVGKNPLEAARIKANQSGADGDAVGAATGKLLGAELAQTVKTPFETLQTTMEYYRSLLREGDVSNRTFQRAQLAAFQQAGLFKQSDVSTAGFEHLKNQFSSISAGILNYRMGGVDSINQKVADDKKKREDDKSKDSDTQSWNDNSKATDDNTLAVKDLTRAVAKGIGAFYV